MFRREEAPFLCRVCDYVSVDEVSMLGHVNCFPAHQCKLKQYSTEKLNRLEKTGGFYKKQTVPSCLKERTIARRSVAL